MKNKNLWVLVIVMLILLVMISYTGDRREAVSLLEEYLMAVVVPVQKLFSGLGQSIQSVVHAVLSHQEIKAENMSLREAFGVYQEKVIMMEELKLENSRLKEMLDFREESPKELVAARVIGRDPGRWFNTVTLDRGTDDGVRKEMPVVTPQGLVGMVSSATRNTAEVILLTDPRLAVSAMVQQSRDPGITGISEAHPDQYHRLRFTNLLPDADVNEGDSIVTSGLGEIYSRNIMIGVVEEVGMDEHGLVKMAVVKPSVDLSKLEEVFVIVADG